MIEVSAYKWVPPFAQGQVRDLRVRWALEEAGIPYKSKLIGFEDQKTPAYRAWQPFGQVPAMSDNGLLLFESGALVLRIAERSEVLLPKDDAGRARAITWLFCALNTIEVVVQGYGELFFHKDEEWVKARKPQLAERVRLRLHELAAVLGDKDYLDGRFSCGDLMMSTIFRILSDDPEFLDAEPKLKAYHQRCEARPAFKRALDAQMNDFEKR